MMDRRILYLLILSPIALISTIAISMLIQPQRSDDVFAVPGFKASESSLGERLSLAEAHQDALFSFKVPNSLPAGTTLDRVYISDSKETVYIFYNNPNLPLFTGSGSITTSLQITTNFVGDVVDEAGGEEELPMIVKVVEDGEERIVAEIPQDRHGVVVKVCATEGIGNDPSDTQKGLLSWSSDGVSYLISSRISLDRVIIIANSMC